MKARVKRTNEIVDVYHEPQHGQQTVVYKEAVFVNGRTWSEDELEFMTNIDWEQRRYEIAKEMLPYAADTSRSILMSGYGLGDDAKGKTLAEVCASSAVAFADALIKELKKNKEGKGNG